MGLFDWVGRKFGFETKAVGSTSLSAFFGINVHGQAPSQYKPMTRREMLEMKKKLTVVFSCVQAISQAFQEAPLTVVRGEDEEPVPDAPALGPFTDNPWLSDSDMKRYIIEHLELTGTVYLWKWADQYGIVRELWPLPPDWVTPKPFDRPLQSTDRNRIIESYTVTPPGYGQFDLPPEAIVYIRDIDPSSLWAACSPLGSALHPVRSTQKADEMFAQAMDSLKVPGLVVKTSRPLTNDQQQALHRALEEKLGSSGRKNALIVSGDGTTVETINPLAQMDWNLIRDYDEVRICQAFRVPPIVAGCWVGMKNSPWSNTGEAWRSFYEHKMVGRWQQVAQSLTRHLMPKESDLHYKFDLRNIKYLQEEQALLIDRSTRMFQSGLITRNRALEIIGEKQIDEKLPYGHETMLPMGMTPTRLDQEPEPVAPEPAHGSPAETAALETGGSEGKGNFNRKGGAGSGNFGHAGQGNGEVGGSGAGGGNLRYDPSTDKHNGRRLVRGDILADAAGNKYRVERNSGFILQVDRLEGERSAGIQSISVDPSDKDRFKDVHFTGSNFYDVKE